MTTSTHEMVVGLLAAARANALEPCPSESARRRHIIRTETCSRCGVEGAIPETMWRGRT